MNNINATQGSRVYVFNTKLLKIRHICLGIDNCDNIASADIGAEAILTIDEVKELIKALQKRIDDENIDF